MTKRTAAATVVLALGLLSGGAEAQGVLPFAAEVRGGFAVPTGDWNEEDDIENGFGFGANVQLQVLPLVMLYGGWERYAFGIDLGDDPDFEGVDADATDSGFRAGAKVALPLQGLTGLAPFAFAGLTYSQVETGASDGGSSISFESDNALGFEVGGGVEVPVAPALSLTPALRYRSHAAEFDAFAELGGEETTVSYISLDVGLKLGL